MILRLFARQPGLALQHRFEHLPPARQLRKWRLSMSGLRLGLPLRRIKLAVCGTLL
jgi:hypothetical protein